MLGTRSYTPYGMVRSTTGSFNTKLGFIGRNQSSTTGLTYIRARYYDASVGRFTRVDLIKDGLNWYGYVGGNPIRYYDPYGLFSMSCPIVQSALERLAMTWGTAFAEPTPIGEVIAIGVSGGIIINGAWDIYTYNKGASDDGRGKRDIDDVDDPAEWPDNPDDWVPPKGINEGTKTKDATNGEHRQWKDEDGNILRRWDKSGREGGKERGPHWHDSKGNHIDPGGGINN
ncbi:RHS repeat-associated core domain-containing protein [Orenia marismortui]|uniref:RHS repeat-associated protein n=1 Tax=Orenia marismortui TaxID=46469 RepID=A0A4R8H6Z2_9FIRM|nr:RHS repeat-associated core domain-containing protein [Orenia marismortui]TDX51131.1 RHS repeat-associated protein [Orenia marismortui]